MNEIKKTTGGCPIILAAKTLASAAAGAVVETVGVAGECLDRTPRLSYQLMRRNYYDNRLHGHSKVVSALEALGSGIAYSIIAAGSIMIITPFLAYEGFLDGCKDGWNKGGLYALGQSVKRTQELQEELLDPVKTLDELTHEADEKAKRWEIKSSELVVSSSPCIAPDGTIYVGSHDNNLYAIAPDGSVKWKVPTGGGGISSSPRIGPDGTIYVGSNDGNLYAVNPDGTVKMGKCRFFNREIV